MNARILIVDDEPNIVISIEYLLKKEGFAVAVAHDGEAALAAYVDAEACFAGGRCPSSGDLEEVLQAAAASLLKDGLKFAGCLLSVLHGLPPPCRRLVPLDVKVDDDDAGRVAGDCRGLRAAVGGGAGIGVAGGAGGAS